MRSLDPPSNGYITIPFSIDYHCVLFRTVFYDDVSCVTCILVI